MRRLNPLIMIILVFVVGIFLKGCVTTENKARMEPVEPISNVDTTYLNAKLVTGSNLLLGNVLITDPKFRTVGKMTQVQVTVKNLTENEYTLEYKFDWADMEGFVVESRSVWHRFRLSPHEIRNFSSTGKTPEAKKIIFTVRLPHDVM